MGFGRVAAEMLKQVRHDGYGVRGRNVSAEMLKQVQHDARGRVVVARRPYVCMLSTGWRLVGGRHPGLDPGSLS